MKRYSDRNLLLYLIGNKCDLNSSSNNNNNNNNILKDQVLKYANELNMKHMEISAYQQISTNQCLSMIVSDIILSKPFK